MNLTHKWRVLEVWDYDHEKKGNVIQYQERAFLWFKIWKHVEYDDVKRLKYKFPDSFTWNDFQLGTITRGGFSKVIFTDEHKANEAVIFMDELLFQNDKPFSPRLVKEMGPTSDMTYEEVIAREG